MAKTNVVIAAFLWMLVGIMIVPFLVREFRQPTNVVRQPTNEEGYNAQRVQSAAEANVEQKPPTDHAWEAPLTLLVPPTPQAPQIQQPPQRSVI